MLLLALMASRAFAANRVTVKQVEQVLTQARDKADAEVAQQLAGLELTERLSTSRLQYWEAAFPGPATHGALVMLADSSALLDPPAEEILKNATPDATTLRQMMVLMVNYVNKTVRQLPNFMATRETTGFEDSPEEDVLGQTGVTSYSYQPLHVVGKTSVRVVYRDRREEVDDAVKKAGKHGSQVQGLKTSGEFGPILSTVVADAVRGKITWSRWDQAASGPQAVFHYVVPKETSHYVVQFCCVSEGFSAFTGLSEWHIYTETTAYHGEITFDPTDGTILRMTAEAELPPGDLVSKAAMLVEYGPVEIGGKSFIFPTKSVSILLAHTTPPPPGARSASSYKGAPKTFLNDVAFGQYHQFRAEAHIVTGSEADAQPTHGP